MCEPASFVLTETNIYWSRYNESHESIIEEFGLKDDRWMSPRLLRVEISPQGSDFTLPPDEWVFKVDQDSLPRWYDRHQAEKRVRKALPQWIKMKVVMPSQKLRNVTRNLVAVYGEIDTFSGILDYLADGASIGTIYGYVINALSGSRVHRVAYCGHIEYLHHGAETTQVLGMVDRCQGSIGRVLSHGVVRYLGDKGTIGILAEDAVLFSADDHATVQRVEGVILTLFSKNVKINEMADTGRILKRYDGPVYPVRTF